MTVSALEILQALDFLDQSDRVVDLSQFELIDLQKKLHYYRSSRIQSISKDADDSLPGSDDLAVVISSTSARNDVESLLPSCFMYNRLYANDPLINIANPKDELSDIYKKAFSLDNVTSLDLEDLTKALKYFSNLAPLIRIGAIHILPIKEVVSPSRMPGEGLPIFMSQDLFRSEIPDHIHDFIHQNANISEVAPFAEGGGLIIFDRPPSSPTRGIAVQFKNDSANYYPPFYLLQETRLEEKVSDTQLRLSFQLDWENPPSQSQYEAWVYQSVNRTIISRLHNVARELSISGNLKATYLTESQFESELCSLSFGDPADKHDRSTAVNFLNANSPYLSINDPQTLANMRSGNPKIFERWQHSLMYAIQELNGYEGDFSEYSKQLFEKEIQPQIDELNKALIKMSGGIGGATLLTAGTIGLALLSSATLPFAAVLGFGALAATGRAMPSIADYITARKGPAFIWKKIIK
tara:strand:- start:34882 stop:36282 length:1401 start_codon:yes stop_codon:yes gene_type:complete